MTSRIDRRVHLLWTGFAVIAAAGSAHAQLVDQYFPATLPGYASDLTLPMAAVPPLVSDVRLGSFDIGATGSQGFGYDSAPLGAQGHGSAVLTTAAKLTAGADWERDAIGVAIGVDNDEYPEEPIDNRVNWNASAGGSVDLGRGTLSAGYSHLSRNLIPTDLGALGVSAPVPYTVNDARTSYDLNFGRLRVIPSFDYRSVSFGAVTTPFPLSYAGLDHKLEIGGLTGLWAWSDNTALVGLTRGTLAQYAGSTPTRNDYTDILGLAGVDVTEGLFRVRALFGGERRSLRFFPAQSSTIPAVEVDVVYQATRLTSVSTIVSNTFADPSQPFLNSESMTDGHIELDHELRRNVRLSAFGDIGSSAYRVGVPDIGTSHELRTAAGASASWTLNRRVELNMSYRYNNNDYGSQAALPPVLTGGRVSFDSHSVSLGISLAY